jgi:ABC-type branched-subunit amino acid transport system permease subunit
VIVGGAGTLVGPIIGAAFFMLVSNLLSSWTDSWALFFGLIFIAFVLFAPQGIWGLLISTSPTKWGRSARLGASGGDATIGAP